MSLVLPGVRAALTPRWVSDPLWLRAQQVPALDIRFTNRSIVDVISGLTPTFTRTSSVKLAWNGSTFQSYAADVPAFELVNGIWQYASETGATNALLRSGTVATTGWTGGTNLTLTSAVATLGLLSGDRLARIANTTGNDRTQSTTIAAGQVTISAIVEKGAVGEGFGLRLQPTFANRADASFDLAAGTVVGTATQGTASGSSAKITRLIGNIFRCELTATVDANPSAIVIPCAAGAGAASISAASAVLSDVIVYHVQVETGVIASSPIVTTGSTVARSGDVMVISGNAAITALLQSGDLTFYTEHVPVAWTGGNQFVLSVDNSASGVGVDEVRFFEQGTGNRNLLHSSSNVSQTSQSGGTATAGQLQKYAYAMGLNNSTAAINGFTRQATDTSCIYPVGLNRITLGRRSNSSFGHVCGFRRFTIFAGRLADSRLDAMVA
jgi:hypothetical protein